MATEQHAFSVVYKYIQAAYLSTDNLIRKWDSCISENFDSIKSFLTALDQLNSSNLINPSHFNFTNSGDIRAGVTYEIHKKISNDRVAINQALSTLEDIVDEMKTKLDKCVNEWNKTCAIFEFEKFMSPKGVYPAVCQLIFWLEEIYFCYRNGYVLRKLLVESYGVNDEAPRLMTEWPMNSRSGSIENIWMNMQLFAKLNIDELDALTVEEDLEKSFSGKLSISVKNESRNEEA